uniref:Bcl-2/adenovirus E1B 19 kDa-interacting protein 2-like protein n=1 Tax=Jaculus jaculus TaxID=51337 RepID=A0A8C5K5P9_JACJA
MGTMQEAEKKPADVGIGEKAEAAETGAALRLGELELKEEWQDEEFPRLLPEEVGSSRDLEDPHRLSQKDTPRTLALCGQRPMRKRLSAPDGTSSTLSSSSSSGGSLDLEIDELETPSDSEQLDSGHEFEWEGYHGDGLNAVILFASCYLPQSSVPNYTYVMEHLFRYIVGTLELLVAENYLLVHLSGGTSRAQVPPLGWIRQCYLTLDRRLRKNLRALVVVHATWYVKAFLALLRPFISSKFTRKIRFLDSLGELAQLISLDQVHIPETVRQLDQDLHGSRGT